MSGELGKAVLVLATDQVTYLADLDKAERRALALGTTFDKTGRAATGFSDQARRLGSSLDEAFGRRTEAGLQTIIDKTKSAHEKTQQWTSSARSLAAQLGLVFSVGAVIGFGRELIQVADDIVKFSDRTGLTIEQVQRLQHVAEQTGVSIDGMMNAVQNLQQRLGEGDKSAVGAMKDLGLKTKEFLQLDPYKQFLQIAEAAGKVENPTQRAAIMADLFGKSWKEIGPAVLADIQKIAGEAPVMADKTVLALDRAGDAWAKFARQIKVWLAESYNYVGHLFDLMIANIYERISGVYDAIAKAAALASKVLPSMQGGLVATAMSESAKQSARWFLDAAAALRTHGESAATATPKVAALITRTKESTEAAKAQAEEYRKNLAEAKKQEEQYNRLVTAGEKYNRLMESTTDLLTRTSRNSVGATVAHSQLTEALHAGAEAWLRQHEAASSWMLRALPGIVVQMDTAIPKVEKFTINLGELSNSLANLAQISDGLFGKMAQGLSTLVASIDTATKAWDTFKSGMKALDAGSLLAGITSIASGIMGIVSAAMAAGRALVGLFDRDKGRDLVEEYAKSFGGFDALQKKLEEMGEAGAGLWEKLTQGVGRNNPEQAQRVIAEVEAAIQRWEQQQAAANVQTEEGAQATIETASEAAKALDDLNERITGNADEWAAWSDRVTEQIGRVAWALGGLNLTSPSGGAAIAPANVNTTYSSGSEALDVSEVPGVIPMARGGWGKVTRPTLFAAGELGPEEFLFSGGNRSFRFGGFDPKDLVQHLTLKIGERVAARATVRGYAREAVILGV